MINEITTSLLFLIAVWITGLSVLQLLKSRETLNLLAFPMGAATLTIISCFAYFRLTMTAEQIRYMIVGIAILSLIYIIKKGIIKEELRHLGILVTLFAVLMIPAAIGGEQYYVFRGNNWDHFNYISMGYTISQFSWPFYSGKTFDALLQFNDIIAFGGKLVQQDRPYASLLYALQLDGRGDLYLKAYAFLTVFWAGIYSSVQFLWNIVIDGLENKKWYICCLPPIAYVLGFWGQISFDINAWSQIVSMNVLIAVTAVFVLIIRELSWNTKQVSLKCRQRTFVSEIVVLASGAFIIYPESSFAHGAVYALSSVAILLLFRKTISWKGLGKLIIIPVAAMLISVALNGGAILEFAMKQLGIGAGSNTVEYWKYFDMYLAGIALAPNIPLLLLGAVPSAIGLYFVTPDYYNHNQILVAIQIAIMAVIVIAFTVNLILTTKERLLASKSDETEFTKSFVWIIFVISMLLIVANIILMKFWVVGKLFIYTSPYLFLALCLILVTRENRQKKQKMTYKLGVTFSVVLILCSLIFAGARVVTSGDPNGIGYYRNYPSILHVELKTTMRWNFPMENLKNCKTVWIESPDQIFLHYMKQKLLYAGKDYYTDTEITDLYGVGNKKGRMAYKEADGYAYQTENDGVMRIISGEGKVKPAEKNRVINIPLNQDLKNRIYLSGFGEKNDWGRWTIDNEAKVLLPYALESRSVTVTLYVEQVIPEEMRETMSGLGMIFGESELMPTIVQVGRDSQDILINEKGVYYLEFKNVSDCREIKIISQNPVMPLSLGWSADRSLLGIGLEKIIIEQE